jgi:signal transduction histidine kinase
MRNKEKHKNQKATLESGSSLATRLLLPTVLIIIMIYLAVSLIGSQISQSLYNRQTTETLNNNLQLAEKALYEGWRNTEGAALRTEDLLKAYTLKVLAGRLDFIGFGEQSGVMIVDSYTGRNIQTYPSPDIYLNPKDIQRILKQTSASYFVYELQKGGFALSFHFAPLGLHVIAFNKVGFDQTSGKKNQQILLISVFMLTTAMLMLMLFIVIYLSITKPLRDMQQKMAYMMDNDIYNEKLKTNEGSLEIQQLSGKFNVLIQHIHERDQQIHKHADTLEKTVKKRTSELQKTQKQLVLKERLAAIGEFASSVAHELRNPLSSIKLGVEKISEIPSIEGKNKRRLTLIQKEVERLSDMLSGILAFAAPSAIKIEDIHLKNFLSDVIHLTNDMQEKESRQIDMQKIEDNLIVKADFNKLQQTLINVFKNAFEASPNHSTISIHIEDKKQKIRIHILNEGETIPQDVQSRLFEPFFTTKSRGTGLGLATTKRLMQEMGGDITLENKGKNHILTILKLLKKA